jgi:Ca2+-binding EF-hand superfamily protein
MEETWGTAKSNSQYWKRPDDLKKSYKGHVPQFSDRLDTIRPHYRGRDEPHPLEVPYTIKPTCGYSGYLPHASTMTGGPAHLGEKEEVEPVKHGEVVSNFRNYAKNMDTIERYTNAVEQLKARGQTQTMLIRLVQNKLAERVMSYAEQKLKTRLLFEAMDVNGDFVLDETEFRICLEKVNVQLDDVQSLALFAYFDEDYGGSINWQEFSDVVMVANPRGGNAVLPKAITATVGTGMWNDVMDTDAGNSGTVGKDDSGY